MDSSAQCHFTDAQIKRLSEQSAYEDRRQRNIMRNNLQLLEGGPGLTFAQLRELKRQIAEDNMRVLIAQSALIGTLPKQGYYHYDRERE